MITEGNKERRQNHRWPCLYLFSNWKSNYFFNARIGYTAKWLNLSLYFFGVSAGFSGAAVVSGAGGAGASAGFASSLAAGFGASLALHPIPIEAILIIMTNARKRKIHFFM
jgi:hypothetical protein